MDVEHGQNPAEHYKWRLRPVAPGHGSSRAPPSATRRAPGKARRRPEALDNLTHRSSVPPEGSRVDDSLLYPQISGYNDNSISTDNAPNEFLLAPRCHSQPNTPNHLRVRSTDSPPIALPSLGIPRAPTYPPAGRRRMHSDSGLQGDAFRDEEEFRLFVEATAGLEPEQARRLSNAQSPPRHLLGHISIDSPNNELISPLEETPTTIQALRDFAQMPRSGPSPGAEHLSAAIAGLDLVMDSPAPPLVSPLEQILHDDDLLQTDDELPDYASSQAQAQTAQRAEAARRAQELQRRWQQSATNRRL
ncbi:hypothetical protein B0A50_06712 [Salinomyces thailandicus]|uniref:Uncharacterized protein n=1 Tax=Salinomyces thailandicus TaxID=706561 RepID=A0A4U0TRA2_9PEZI|nr:hypothetical protein B0A50_06712 [Salinomyces thailandica]